RRARSPPPSRCTRARATSGWRSPSASCCCCSRCSSTSRCRCCRGGGGQVLELRGVRHRYDGRVVLDLERFAVPPGALIAIVGPNGAGKRTLPRLLALLERPTEGAVLLEGRPPGPPPRRARGRVG